MSSPSENPLRNLIREIHRRSLWQVLGIYLAGSWVAYEIVQGLTEGLGLPPWLPGLAVALLVIGLPIVLATAFVQEGGPEVSSAASVADLEDILSGDDSPKEQRTTLHRLFNWRNAILGGAAAFVLLTTVALTWMSVARDDPSGSLQTVFGEVEGESSLEASVAVLPFDNLSADPEQQYFSDGVADQILSALTRLPGLKVTARTSSFAFRDASLDIRAIADSLGVATVLEGTVQRTEDRVRITAQLIEAETGFRLWSETYERELTDIFEVQDDVARRIAERLRGEFTATEEDRLTSTSTANPRAHDLYLQGKQLLYRRTASGIAGAVEAFEQAIREDPDYAPAYSGLASAYGLGVSYSVPPGDSTPVWSARALAFGDRSVELDSSNAEGYAARAWATIAPPLSASAYRSTVDDLERALELRPSFAEAHGWYGVVLSVLGRHAEASEAHERSLELDPVSPGRRLGYAYSALMAERAGLAIEQVRRARELQPGLGGLVDVLEIMALLLEGRPEECLRRDLERSPHLAACLHEMGREEDAEELIASVERAWHPGRPWLEADGLASYYAWTGDVENAIHWLERGLGASSYLQTAPGAVHSVFPPGIWEPVLSQDEPSIQGTIERMGDRIWRRISEERGRVGLP